MMVRQFFLVHETGQGLNVEEKRVMLEEKVKGGTGRERKKKKIIRGIDAKS